MTRPRRHEQDHDACVALDAATVVTMGQYATMLTAYCADHPQFTPPRTGVRGNAARLGQRALPEHWWRPYLHLISRTGPAAEPGNLQ